MKKNTEIGVNVKTYLKDEVLMEVDKVYHGTFIRDGYDHYRFVQDSVEVDE